MPVVGPMILAFLDSEGRHQHSVELSGNDVSIGRGDECPIMLDDVSVSRRHCRLFRLHADDGWRVQDLGSTNGTLVNGKPIAHGSKSIEHGDVIRCGARAGVCLGLAARIAALSKIQQKDEPGYVAEPSSSGERQLLWALALLSAILTEEKARRGDAEHQVAELRVKVHRMQCMAERLAATAERGAQAELRSAAVQEELENLSRKLRTRDKLLEEARTTTQLLIGQLERYETERASERDAMMARAGSLGERK